jgi:hypothetical protein
VASFGSYGMVEAAHRVTHHVQGSIMGDLLVGKDLPRKFEFAPDEHLIIRSTGPDEHWFVTWAHYQEELNAKQPSEGHSVKENNQREDIV